MQRSFVRLIEAWPMHAARREKKLREPSARNGAEMSGGLDVRILDRFDRARARTLLSESTEPSTKY